MPSNPPAAANLLLAAMPQRNRQHFLAACETVMLVPSEILADAGERIRHVYFPTTGLISLVAPVDGRARLEVGLIGNEGMLGTSLLLGVEVAPLHALVQGGGAALRIATASFLQQQAQSLALQRILKRYLHVVMQQFAQTAACSHFHLVEARLARWLLMTQDRVHSEQLHVTHEFLAYMLGVRRVGITRAATALQERQLIRYHRGEVTILDRAGLEAASCSCYAADKATYAQGMA